MRKSRTVAVMAVLMQIVALCHVTALYASLPESREERLNRRVDTKLEYEPLIAPPTWIVPSLGLPEDLKIHASNNNVAIVYHQDRLYLAWRTAPIHFASDKAIMYIVSSKDWGWSWQLEKEIAIGTDLREPFFLSLGEKLMFYYVELGKSATKFEPKRLWRMSKIGKGAWSEPETWGEPGELAWDFKVRNGKAWMTSYSGSHYGFKNARLDVHFKTSDDGEHWRHVDPVFSSVYSGGVSEVSFEFADNGRLWAITRNEDGDETGFGSHLAIANPDDLAFWDVPSRSDPRRFDSPRMFRHGKDIYLIARRDVGGDFGSALSGLSFDLRRWYLLGAYSRRPKRTALYKIDQRNRKVVHLQDLPSAGDTAFPSIVRVSPNSFLVANYTSPLRHHNRSWIWGQLSPEGTQIYFVNITFKAK